MRIQAALINTSIPILLSGCGGSEEKAAKKTIRKARVPQHTRSVSGHKPNRKQRAGSKVPQSRHEPGPNSPPTNSVSAVINQVIHPNAEDTPTPNPLTETLKELQDQSEQFGSLGLPPPEFLSAITKWSNDAKPSKAVDRLKAFISIYGRVLKVYKTRGNWDELVSADKESFKGLISAIGSGKFSAAQLDDFVKENPLYQIYRDLEDKKKPAQLRRAIDKWLTTTEDLSKESLEEILQLIYQSEELKDKGQLDGMIKQFSTILKKCDRGGCAAELSKVFQMPQSGKQQQAQEVPIDDPKPIKKAPEPFETLLNGFKSKLDKAMRKGGPTQKQFVEELPRELSRLITEGLNGKLFTDDEEGHIQDVLETVSDKLTKDSTPESIFTGIQGIAGLKDFLEEMFEVRKGQNKRDFETHEYFKWNFNAIKFNLGIDDRTWVRRLGEGMYNLLTDHDPKEIYPYN
jgi:hypothetical protein